MIPDYDPQAVEREAQTWWETQGRFHVVEDPAREKYYCLSMFPYPSGALHMGHVRNYTIGDVVSRYQRMQGRNVLQPMGWDAFGLPAENAAIQNQVPPAHWTYRNIEQMKAQMRRLGFAYDWGREVTTCCPDYYRWEQWFFNRLFRKGIAYKKKALVNWDPVDQTVLANEQVMADGRGWRSGALVERREISQWFLKITDYADELLEWTERLDGWPDAVRTMQRNWIGRSEGVRADFEVVETGEVMAIFTTRPDTIMGVSFMAVAAEHPIAVAAARDDAALETFLEECKRTGTSEAQLQTMEKKGFDTGLHARHPLTGENVPIWVANFVLMTYGTGAIMGVPGHDQRDWEFCTQYGLPIVPVIFPADGGEPDVSEGAQVIHGVLGNSGPYDGMTSAEAFDAIAAELESRDIGERQTQYRLRDWGVSRQRYWGCPVPIVNCPGCGAVPVPDEELPVLLPEDVTFSGVASPLKAMEAFYRTRCPECGGEAERETDTFDTFVESSWYYARFACPDADGMLDERADYWLPVDRYIGGIEHAVLHLLYARFFHKVMRDEGLVASDEPFTRMLTQGMVLKDGAKMSKSKGNTVDPEAMIERYGADTVRLYVMFTSPPDQSLEWNDEAVAGSERFLRKLWAAVHRQQDRIAGVDVPPSWASLEVPAAVRELRSRVHELLERSNRDYERLQFNTVIAACMESVNALERFDPGPRPENGADPAGAAVRETLDILLRVLAPIVPHVVHSLWRTLGHEGDPLDAPWPRPDAGALARERVRLAVQVNGKRRGEIEVPADAERSAIEATALAEPSVARHVGGEVRRIIVVPGRLVNIVAS